MIRPHLRHIPAAAFPDGYGVRAMRPEDGPLWVDIWRDAEPYYTIGDNLFMEQFGSDLPAIPQRCYLITGPRGTAVGTISAWYKRDFQGADAGQIHWLAIRPAHQRKGLARAAMSYALGQLAQWHQRAFLGTQTARLGAIGLYLDFGFVPDMTEPGAAEAWAEVGEKLSHPLLAACCS